LKDFFQKNIEKDLEDKKISITFAALFRTKITERKFFEKILKKVCGLKKKFLSLQPLSEKKC